MKYTARTYLNESDHRFWQYAPGDAVVAGPELGVEVHEDVRPHAVFGTTQRTPDAMLATALDYVWAAGNDNPQPGTTGEWPHRTIRSLSSADLIELVGHGVWAVDPAGFRWVGLVVPADSLAAGRLAPCPFCGVRARSHRCRATA